ncbi:MAG: hypothetical protein AAF067_12560, partial [Pseudomonadota bacterium]
GIFSVGPRRGRERHSRRIAGMPFEILLTLSGYLLSSFILTAMLVRFAPKTEAARISRKRFYFFPFAPVMIITQWIAFVVKWLFLVLLALPYKMIRRAFEILSGHKRRRRKTYYRY